MRIVLYAAALTCITVFVFAGAATADTIHGTNGNDWGPNSLHPNQPLPHDCGSHNPGSALDSSAGSDTIWGHDGCDFVFAKAGNDLIFGGREMDWLYGDKGNDDINGDNGHDHLIGEEGDDRLDTRDGANEAGDKEETRGGPGTDNCLLDPDPDGVKFAECEKLNGSSHPFGQGFVNTGDDGNQTHMRAEVNNFLANH